MVGRGGAERRVLKIGAGGEARRARDRLAVEEPLELRVAGRPVGVTMRTPGNDVELAIGYCISERLVARPDNVEAVRFCAPEGQAQEFNVLTVDLRPGVPVPDPSLDRLAVTSSSCGVCGKASIEAVTAACPTVAGDGLAVPSRVLSAIPGRVREAQRVFEQTGGLHAAAVCDAEGGVLCAIRSPYDAALVPNTPALLTYSDVPPSLEALAAVLAGERRPMGRTPVRI